MNQNKKIAYFYAGVSILLWSTSATVSKLLLGSINSMQILLVSSFLAFLFLLIVNIFKGNLKLLKELKWKDYQQLIITGLLGTFLYNLFLYLGINHMQASQAFIINYLWPMMTVIFACIILKEKMTFKKIIAIILSFIGVIIVTSNGNLFHIDQNSLIGALYCVLAAVSYGLFSVFNKQNNYNKYISTMLFYFLAFLISLIYTLLFHNWFIPQINQLLGLIWTGVFTSAIGITAWTLAIEKGDTAKISNLAYITPFLSLIWTGIVLKETISIYAILGLALIILGVFIQLKEKV